MDNLMGTITNFFNKFIGWIDTLFGYFGTYSKDYSKLIIYAVVIFVASKMIKIKWNIGGGRR